MSNKSTEIFTKIPKTGYEEAALEINSSEFVKVVESRRSVRVFTDERIPDEVVKKCLELSLLAPSSSNLQPWEFYWVKQPQTKKEIVRACLSQPAARTADTLIVCVARTKTWKENSKMMLEFFDNARKEGQSVPDSAIAYYKKLVPIAYTQGPLNILGYVKRVIVFFKGLSSPTPREPVSKAQMITWATKSCALACQNLMLSFRAFGYDTCPMEGYDSSILRKVLDLSSDAYPVMVIGAGKRAKEGVYGPQVRFDSSLFIKEV